MNLFLRSAIAVPFLALAVAGCSASGSGAAAGASTPTAGPATAPAGMPTQAPASTPTPTAGATAAANGPARVLEAWLTDVYRGDVDQAWTLTQLPPTTDGTSPQQDPKAAFTRVVNSLHQNFVQAVHTPDFQVTRQTPKAGGQSVVTDADVTVDGHTLRQAILSTKQGSGQVQLALTFTLGQVKGDWRLVNLGMDVDASVSATDTVTAGS
ncbi:hypothetical protein [Streptomyces sp. CBMA123]|uniref:hypothetical protein n=1 Tax=Streptomyces sp. CBMA123 TaxID=1896313 RepID=UPI0016619334|nr:hypothetical protein [Streptomyces sp. CBMA123]MBD0694957.1 hypothetical protein [Streptomyces sp. CBMA123]